MDISAVNEKLHNWSRFDTFQTPQGRADSARAEDSPYPGPMAGPEAEMTNQAACMMAMAREMDAFRKDMTRCMRDVRMELSASRKTHEKTSEAALSAVERSKSELMEAIKQDRQRLGANLERIVKDSKADDLDDVVKMIKESVIASCSHIITATKDRASSDLGEAIAVLQESREADMSQVIREVRENKREDLTLFMKAVRDDVSNVCEAFKSGQSQDLQTLTRAIQESERRLEGKIESKIESTEAIVGAIRRSMGSMDPEVYIAAVREEIHKVRTKVDFSPILKAIQDIRLDVDMRPVVQAIEEQRSEVNLGPVLRAIQEHHSAALAQQQEQQEQREQRPPSVDLSPVLSAIQDIGIVVDFAPILEAIREMKPEAPASPDVGPLLAAIHQMKTEVDLTPAFETIRYVVREATGDSVRFAVREAMREARQEPSQPRLDLGVGGLEIAPILAAIHDVKTLVRAEVGPESQWRSDLASVHRNLEAGRSYFGGGGDVDMGPMLQQIAECRSAVRQCVSKAEAENIKDSLKEQNGSLIVSFNNVVRKLADLEAAYFRPLSAAMAQGGQEAARLPDARAAVRGPEEQNTSATTVAINDVVRKLADLEAAYFRPFAEAMAEGRQEATRLEEQLSQLQRQGPHSRQVSAEEHDYGHLRQRPHSRQVSPRPEESFHAAPPDLQQLRGVIAQETEPVIAAFNNVVRKLADLEADYFQPLAATLSQGRQEVDLSPLLLAIRETRSEIDLTMIKSGVTEQVTAAVDAVRERVSRENGQLNAKLEGVLQEVSGIANILHRETQHFVLEGDAAQGRQHSPRTADTQSRQISATSSSRPLAATPDLQASSLRGLKAATSSGRAIEVLERVPAVGDRTFTDRELTFLSLGDFAGQDMYYVRPPNDDKACEASSVMWTLTSPVDCTVYLDLWGGGAHAQCGLKAWLDGWTPTPMEGVSFLVPGRGPSYGPGRVFRRDFKAGKISICGNGAQEHGTFVVFVKRR